MASGPTFEELLREGILAMTGPKRVKWANKVRTALSQLDVDGEE